jgi:uncharacterized iron-regulated protein
MYLEEMKTSAKSIAFFLALSVLLTAAKSCSGADRIFRASDGKTITFETMIEDLKNAKVIFVGETHNSKRDHEFQLAVIRALHRSGVPPAIGLEMFRAESQDVLDQWVGGRLELREFLKVYYDNWGIAWPLYRDIFQYSRDNKIPLIGLNVPAGITRKVSREGFSSLTQEELKKLPPGISCNVDDKYMDFIRRAYAVHSGREKSFVNFCEAQMVWDKAMAWNLTRFQKKSPERVTVVLAGVGHSWKRGIPGQMEELPERDYRVILPEIPGRIGRTDVLSHDTDYILLK